jgi:hypothetical protein
MRTKGASRASADAIGIECYCLIVGVRIVALLTTPA